MKKRNILPTSKLVGKYGRRDMDYYAMWMECCMFMRKRNETMSTDETETTQIQTTKYVANQLRALMKVGDTYDSVLRRLLKLEKATK